MNFKYLVAVKMEKKNEIIGFFTKKEAQKFMKAITGAGYEAAIAEWRPRK